MNTVRSCFAATSILVVVISWSTTNAVVCCNSSSITIGGGVASCQNGNRTFHTVEAIGGATCDDNQTAVPVRKCCPPGQLYDPEVRFCIQAGLDGDVELRRMMQLLRDGFREVADAVMVGYDYGPPLCEKASMIDDVASDDWSDYMGASSLKVKIPPLTCFDFTPFDEFVVRTCQPRAQYCEYSPFTCVNKCCKLNQRFIVSLHGAKCEPTDKPFTLSVYNTTDNYHGRLRGLSNYMALPYNEELKCVHHFMILDEFKVTPFGLYFTDTGEYIVDHLNDPYYCIDYFALESELSLNSSLIAIMCYTKPKERLIRQLFHESSAVCLALTLLVYAKLSYLRNVHGYYIMCYISCLFVSYVCKIIRNHALFEDRSSQFCIINDYFTLFAFLATYCWLNVICFDIYWNVRYNININKKSSISVRTIMYHIYCWGFSSMMIFSGYLFQQSKNEILKKIAPDIGEFSCWFKRKTMEQVRRRIKVELVSSDDRLRKLINKTTFKNATAYNENLSAITLENKIIKFDKPIYIGLAVLDISKTLMYDYHYNVMKRYYGEKISLMYTDTALSDDELIIFFNIPACVMLTANLIFFLLTAFHCSRIKTELNKFKQTNDLKIQRFFFDKEKFVTSFKLFLVMGIPITIEMPTPFFKKEGHIWDVLYAITSLQGVLTFIILVAKRKVIKDLWKNFRGSMDHNESTQINTISGMS